MDRAEWLKEMRRKTEALYDLISPEFWVSFGFYENETHMEFLQKLMEHIPAGGELLSAACGAGRYDGLLLEAGYAVTGVDQSEGMLERARQQFPAVLYRKMGLQEINFEQEFEGLICMDALENICPEDWPGIMHNFHKAVKPGGWLYFTVEEMDPGEVQASFERAQAEGLPVIYGEMADGVDEAYTRIKAAAQADWIKLAGGSVYHFYPSKEQVREWLEQNGMKVEEEGRGSEYWHYLISNKV